MINSIKPACMVYNRLGKSIAVLSVRMQTSVFHHPEPIFLSLLCFFSAIGRIILSLKACVIAFILTFQFGDQTHLIVLLFYKYQNQWNEGTLYQVNETKNPTSFLLKVLFCYYYYSDIYQHYLKGFHIQFLFSILFMN